MRIAWIGCMVMSREISRLAAESGHIVRTWWLRQGLHDTPDVLRRELQQTIDQVEEENNRLPAHLRFEVICLGYGLCSNGVIGLRPRRLPLVIPRCEDCISLFLGSAERYQTLFHQMPGTYWYTPGWIEQAFTPSEESYARQRAEYVEAYGEDNADYLMECTNSWMKQYKFCAYIADPRAARPDCEAYAEGAARAFGWEYRRLEGSNDYFEALLSGDWDEERFLVCPPGHEVIAEYTGRRMDCRPIESGEESR